MPLRIVIPGTHPQAAAVEAGPVVRKRDVGRKADLGKAAGEGGARILLDAARGMPAIVRVDVVVVHRGEEPMILLPRWQRVRPPAPPRHSRAPPFSPPFSARRGKRRREPRKR